MHQLLCIGMMVGLTDWTFDVAELTTKELEEINNICWEEGWSFTYSTVQCHIKPQFQEKAGRRNDLRGSEQAQTGQPVSAWPQVATGIVTGIHGLPHFRGPDRPELWRAPVSSQLRRQR